MSKAKELIKAELGSERRDLDPKRRLLPPHYKWLFHISRASSGSLADDEQEKLQTLPGDRSDSSTFLWVLVGEGETLPSGLPTSW